MDKLRIVVVSNKVENIGISILKMLGIIDLKVRNLSELNYNLQELSKEGKKFDEIVIGSHGSDLGGNIFMYVDGKDENGEDIVRSDTSFLENLKPLVKPNQTVVLFTSCYGAKNLSVLKHAAEVLDTTVYGFMGISIPGLNKLLNKAQQAGNVFRKENRNKIYSCNSNKTNGSTKMSNVDLLSKFYCRSENTHPVKWLKS